ncbi:MAG: F0F1 ATP synthase subunit A [Acidimicrobiales bacterium]
MSPILASNITIGDHLTTSVFGFTVYIDDLGACVLAGLIVIALGLVLRAKATSGVPGKLQLAFETVVGSASRQIETTMGSKGLFIVPLACTLFVFILFCNWLEMIPTNLANHHQLLVSPTSDINLPAAMAVTVIVLVHVTWVRLHGIRSYIGHYFKPYKVLFPINVIEELVKPVTLSLRLFGNLFASGILLTLIAALPAKWILPVPALDFVWKLFAAFFVAPVQAFIFALLTVIYMESAVAGGH